VFYPKTAFLRCLEHHVVESEFDARASGTIHLPVALKIRRLEFSKPLFHAKATVTHR
jgi:hypothetical protein